MQPESGSGHGDDGAHNGVWAAARIWYQASQQRELELSELGQDVD